MTIPVFFFASCIQLWTTDNLGRTAARSARDPLGFPLSMARPSGLPPGRSQYDGTITVQTPDSIKVHSVPSAQEVEVASRALKEMNNVARADHQRIDLKDLLANSSRDSQYPELPAGVRSSFTYRKPHSGLQLWHSLQK